LHRRRKRGAAIFAKVTGASPDGPSAIGAPKVKTPSGSRGVTEGGALLDRGAAMT
jgi:hypothetical protein